MHNDTYDVKIFYNDFRKLIDIKLCGYLSIINQLDHRYLKYIQVVFTYHRITLPTDFLTN